MSLKFAPSKGEDYQLAVVVSKKVNKSAVVRNRIRRRIYEIIRLARKDVPNPWPYQMILSVHKDEPATLPAGELKKQVLNLLKKAGVI